VSGGTPQIRTDHKALISIRDHIERNGTVEGKQLIGHFTGPPFGWSPDTLRYLVAACLLAGEIKLKVSGREVTVNGQQAIDALKTNNAFKPVGVSLREGKPNMEVLARAAERLTELVGDMVVPLEQEISKAATKHLPRFQSTYAPLGEKLAALRLPGIERVESLNRDIADLLFTDASDAPERLGAEESSLYENLKWAGEVHTAFKQGLETTLRSIQRHCVKIKDLPPSGSPGQLRDDLSETIAQLEERLSKEDFYKHVADFNSRLTDMEARVRDTVASMLAAQKGIIAEAGKDLQRLDEWSELTQEEQTDMLTSLEALQIVASDDLAGLTRLMDQQFVVGSQSEELKRRIFRKGQERIKERAEEAKNKALREGKKVMSQTLRMPKTLTSLDQLDELIQQLQELKKLARYNQIEVTIQTEN
jgi:HPt (histidine-containing phosphotransfer) domain-containing protein